MDFKIIYEDKDLLVVDKPAGVVVFPEGQTTSGTLIEALIEKYPELKGAGEGPRFGVVHRLDKDTSGVLLVAKSAEALIFFQKQFISRRVEKKYVCLVEGRLKTDSGTITSYLARSESDPRKQASYESVDRAPKDAREAVTEYKVLQEFGGYSLLEVQIHTGRKHQIRAQFAALQHPIAGDKLYRFKHSKTPEGLDRQFLHAKELTIQLMDGTEKTFVSPLPNDLQAVLEKLS